MSEGAPGAVRVGEHDEEVADREVDLVARKHEKTKKKRVRKVEERSQHNISNIVLTQICSYWYVRIQLSFR